MNSDCECPNRCLEFAIVPRLYWHRRHRNVLPWLRRKAEVLAVAQYRVRIPYFWVQVVVHIHLNPKHSFSVWEIGTGLVYLPFKGPCVRGMRGNGAAERVYPVIAEVSKVA